MKKVVLLGDSITQGIGKKMINYEELLKNKIGDKYEVINLSHTGTTIKYAVEQIDKINKISPDYIIIFYGNVDAQIRPNVSKDRFKLWSLTPKRYHIGGMLDPRPFYSHKFFKRILEYCDNIYRFFLRKILFLTQGKCQWVDIDTYKSNYNNFIKKIKCKKLIIISNIYIDKKIYKESYDEYIKYNKILNEIAMKAKVKYIDIFNILKKLVDNKGWNNYYYMDHFHPSINGYKIISKEISMKIKEYEDEKN